MKIVAKILLILISIPVFFLCIISINIRFQFLESGFWINSFEKGNVYSQISTSLKDRLIAKVVANGGKGSDVADLSSLISPRNLRLFFENNAKSILTYANGGSKEINVFVPLAAESVPDGADLKDIESTSRQMSLKEFLKEFNITIFAESDITYIAKFGFWSWVFTSVSFALLILIFILIYSLTKAGSRLTAAAVSFSLSGILAGVVYFTANALSSTLSAKFINSPNIGRALAVIIAPPIVANVAQIWLWFGVSGLILGILLFFVKKPAINKSR